MAYRNGNVVSEEWWGTGLIIVITTNQLTLNSMRTVTSNEAILRP